MRGQNYSDYKPNDSGRRVRAKIASLEELHARCTKTESGCILYPSTAHRYGIVVTIHGRMTAQRAAWTFAFGEIPAGQCACHKCDVPHCCNPEHIFLGTHAENMTDMRSKGRSTRYHQRLPDEWVLEMHRLRSLGWKIQPIADRFGITYVSAQYILSGKRHAHLKLLSQCCA